MVTAPRWARGGGKAGEGGIDELLDAVLLHHVQCAALVGREVEHPPPVSIHAPPGYRRHALEGTGVLLTRLGQDVCDVAYGDGGIGPGERL
jgi:hypothetical protein